MADFQNPNLKLPYLHLILTAPKDCYQDLMGQYEKNTQHQLWHKKIT